MYRIAEWQERYEVSIKGREPKDGEELRAGRLLYIRLKVYGHTQGAGYRRLIKACGDRCMEVFGIFCKLLEISGNQPREKRGMILNEKDNPASEADIAFLLGIPEEQVTHALEKLVQVGWIIAPLPEIPGKSGTLLEYNSTQLNSTQLKGTQASGSFRKSPEVVPTYTLEDFLDAGLIVGLTPTEAEVCFDFYKGQQFQFKKDFYIKDARDACKRWRNNRQNFAPKQDKADIQSEYEKLKTSGDL